MKIGILINHEEEHQVPHALPYAYELKRLRPEAEVELLCSTAGQAEFCTELAGRFPGIEVGIRHLALGAAGEALVRLLRPVAFARKYLLLRRHRQLLAGFDALVMPECYSAQQLRRLGYRGRLVGIQHGAGDRAGTFNPKWSEFDMMLLPGQKYVRRFREEGFAWHAVANGYPKLDLFDATRPPETRLFGNGLPTAVYAPHFARDLSSWARFGLPLIEHFAARDDWNLVVAPHVVLFSRRLRHGARDLSRFEGHPRIRIDPGSRASVDMTYMRDADLFIGDISSQVYEYIVRPRPCLFLNAHAVDWRHNPHYANWHLGEVIDDPAGLGAAIDRAAERHAAVYRARQEAAVADTFERIDGQAALRGARAILEFLDAPAQARQPAA